MALHQQITAETGLDVFFCDVHSPWQRGSNENLNGPLRQYFPKSSDLNIPTPERLVEIAFQLNSRPRKTLEWAIPVSLLTEIPSSTTSPTVATFARFCRAKHVACSSVGGCCRGSGLPETVGAPWHSDTDHSDPYVVLVMSVSFTLP